MSVTSPCVNLCRVNQDGLCLGCFRSLAEIAQWSRMDDREKNLVNAALPGRRTPARLVATHALNPCSSVSIRG